MKKNLAIVICERLGLEPNNVESLELHINNKCDISGKAVLFKTLPSGAKYTEDGDVAKEVFTLTTGTYHG